MYSSTKKLLKRISPPFITSFWGKLRYYQRSTQSKTYVKNILAEKDKIYLEIGAGAKKGRNGWITLDISGGSDVCWDLTKGLPFPDESVEKIYSSHLFEHFTFKDGQKLLNECLRVLIPGGQFLICVPNARLYIEAYLKRDQVDIDKYFGYRVAYNDTSMIDYVNYVAYMDGHHKYMFDEENLIAVLKRVGFNNAQLREFNSELDLPSRDFESIYAEASK